MASSSLFSLESVKCFDLPSTPGLHLQVFKLSESNFRLIFIPVPGPLVTGSIIVPTLASNHKGLPHTLEHLVFCGSESIPHRGYLDNLATRCLSTGTNAYTAEDHTSYEIATAGAEGLCSIFPVFLDHILHPTLRDRQFMTEVYHLDGSAKKQGVVYCEMASRENTESDLLDLALRKLLYKGTTTYSFECGGLTPDISSLTNQEIKDYHSKFYQLDNMMAVICGTIDPYSLIQKIESVPHLLTARGKGKGILAPILLPELEQRPTSEYTRQVKFPSSDMDVGSIGYGWRGPPSENLKEITAITVLFRYFYDTPASPFAQTFVERKDPRASNVDFHVRSTIETSLTLIFSGVPLNANSADTMDEDQDSEISQSDEEDEMEDSCESDDDISSDSEFSSQNDNDEPRHDLFQPGVYENFVREVINDFVDKGFRSKSEIQETLDRHKQKLMESLEEDPLETLASQLVPDITRFFLASKSALNDTRATHGVPVLGTRLETFKILDELEKEPLQYWQMLAKKWLLDSPMVQVMMIPDNKMAQELTQKQVDEQQALAKSLGPVGLKGLQAELDAALKENEINLPQSLITQMPPVPDASKIPSFNFSMNIVDLSLHSCPFIKAQIVQTDSVFTHFRLAFHTQSLPLHLRPYLVLFQELLFQSDILIPGSEFMDYKRVAREAARLLISHEAAVGFGNDVWSASWLSEVLMLYGSAERRNWKEAFTFLCRVILFSKFTKKRLVSITKNLLNELTEVKRDGVCMLVAASTRVSFSRRESKGCNDLEISVFRQEIFLKEVLQKLIEGKEDDIVTALEEIKGYLLVQQDNGSPGFAQFAVPKGLSSTASGDSIQKLFMDIWEKEFAIYKKDRKSPLVNSVVSSQLTPFPFPRTPFSMADVDPSFHPDLIIPIPGLGASHLFQIVPCNVLMPHPDYYPLSLLAEILSRTEGLLYSAIRGQGFAYGAGLDLFLWTGQLCFELLDASEPVKGLAAFYDIIKSLESEEKFANVCSDFEMETARASIAYRLVSERATSAGLITTSLRSSLRGLKRLEEIGDSIQSLYEPTRKDLKRVFEKYLTPFLIPGQRLTFVTTADGDQAALIETSFKKELGIKFQFLTLEELALSAPKKRKWT